MFSVIGHECYRRMDRLVFFYTDSNEKQILSIAPIKMEIEIRFFLLLSAMFNNKK